MSGTPDTTAGPAPPTAESGATLGGASGARRRFWSARRVPAGLLALVVLAIAGLFLYDIAAVRAHRPGMSWRHDLARQLAERHLDDVWVLTGAAVAAALGLWLLALALTPGLRSVLTMHRTHPDVRAGLDRDAAATVLRDRALEVAGVQSVRVAVKRKRTDVRAVSHFRDLDEVRDDLTAVLEGAIRGLGLARPSPLTLHVRRPGRKGR
ncbi:DUF6286 domain-containing protein [Streptomyces pseudogriseolus]|uniref:DUF6286 domain-containing protein n=2 Tax=Streptomyces TaxID=1883 RepID=A0AB39NHR5_9ACTN|nr:MULTISPECIES: DUF6286 domain-containing protein [Streptomyces]MCI4144366.1 DUF6286 domain-containing protein [Streptomyces sp. MMS20-AI2-20]GGQ28954.1 hypothetical protein GCM10010233_52870 [Streptomyces gancidicus]GGS57370.1 hypothetical protein GCM10010285_40990 [Streptomyces rubiginosus]